MRSPAQDATVVPLELTAACLHSLARFVEWPDSVWASGETPFVIGVVGREEAATALAAGLHDRTLRRRPVALWHFQELAELSGCQVLWVDRMPPRRWVEIREALRGRPVLTVGHGVEFARHGGMIGLFTESDRMRFAVNRRAIARCGLVLSSRILALAELVDDGAEP